MLLFVFLYEKLMWCGAMYAITTAFLHGELSLKSKIILSQKNKTAMKMCSCKCILI